VQNTRSADRIEAVAAWGRRHSEPGWLLLPLRLFLGVTFSYAGLQKLANPDYLDPHSPTSVAAQMRLLQHSSPIGPLVGLSTHAPTTVGLLIAFGELAVGIGTLLGLFQRAAALGGVLLSLTFFLTVSWNTTPYYYGSDIVFTFAWVTMLGFGSQGALTLDHWLSDRLVPAPARRAAATPAARAGIDRRTAIRTGTAAALAAGGALALGGTTAAIGRAAHGTGRRKAALGPVETSTSAPAHRPASRTGRPSAAGGGSTAGTVIGTTSQVPVHQARAFTDPATGDPAWMVHPAGETFVAFNATCTHAGCPVQYDSSSVQFVCPCHGGIYDARTGAVLQGPPQTPLRPITVQVVSGQLRVDG
jgi:thiosulfate dehydrogenase (quinone) large subunit